MPCRFSQSKAAGKLGFHEQLVVAADKTLGMDTVVSTVKESEERGNRFLTGKSSWYGADTSIWALDYEGDTKMLFSRHVHKLLEFVTRDEQLQKLLTRLQVLEADSSKHALHLREFNEYLFKTALFNVFAHPRMYVLAMRDSGLRKRSFPKTEISPWFLLDP